MVNRYFWTAALAAALLACGSGGGGDDGGDGGGGGGGTPSAGPTSGGGGASTQVGSLLAHAGPSDLTSGANGGWIYVASIFKGDVSLTPTPGSKAKPSWTRPAVALGANPRTLSATSTLASSSSPLLGDDGATPATSLWVKPGAVVTMATTTGVGTVYVNGPVVIEGTLDAGLDDGGPEAASLLLGGSLVVVAPTGLVLARGEDGGTGTGGRGGAVFLAGSTGVFVFGSVDASGGDGASAGGEGGEVIAGFSPIPLPGTGTGTGGWAVLTGSVDVSGGDGDAEDGIGGSGGQFILGLASFDGGGGEGGFFRPAARAAAPELPGDALAYSSGSVNARGGTGYLGGQGGVIWVAGGLTTVVTGPGTLDASGASVVAPVQGGAGGRIAVGVWGGETWAEGTYLLKGGDTGGGTAGQGGSLAVGPAEVGAPLVPSPAVHFSADVDATGGFGDQGGTGGEIIIVSDGDVLGVVDAANVDAANGAGTGSGGEGGTLIVESSDLDSAFGPVAVGVLLRASGGASDEGSGGMGGTIRVMGSETICGEARANGGDSSIEATGADGGAITVRSDDSASTITGPLSVRGGAGGPGDGSPGIVTVDDEVVPLVDGVFVP